MVTFTDKRKILQMFENSAQENIWI